ncbi:flagellin N-terminal helical domain-containing protein [Ralstonia mannitolilytica]|jgi:flagellin|uniref:Flagellin n=1 Tax=Ralstonia mannitolilytica TaxID=105219 RepID=A0AAD2AR20_9RALS|nr:flagellin [Ralstonia mannitolilytica]ATG22115.1 flagellin [Ralstonia pickettii]MBY4717249.1 flagellin [Ralstonia mannitolilytica]CAJ0684155.1 Flagellin [Ralstonia mannitolilytica]CAJ0687846.1 Flagellin [Ralstonia mannitolilytica]CAJ0718009.1 Flagellin [Ralstonia mannitolilytica]
MSLSLNTNISSLQTQQALSQSQSALQTSLERLSTGLRVNSAKDDAAAYAVASSLTTTLNSQTQGIQNANNAQSYLQTADSYLGQVENNLQRMRQLAVEANNGGLSAADQANLDKEYQQLATANKNIATNANYNGNKLFDGTVASVTFQYGQNATTDSATITNVNLSAYGSFTGAGTSVTSAANATAAQTAIDTDLTALKSARASLGAQQSGLTSTINTLTSNNTALSAAKSAMIDTDYAAETSNMTRQNILQQAGTAMLAQANSAPNSILNLLKG